MDEEIANEEEQKEETHEEQLTILATDAPKNYGIRIRPRRKCCGR